MEAEIVQKVANVLKVPSLGKVAYNSENIVTRSKGNDSWSGFSTICSGLAKEATQFGLSSEDLETRCQIVQWLDYTALFVVPARADKTIAANLLKELDAVLRTRSYLAVSFLSVADIAVYFAIGPILQNLSNQEKEQYINISRWFNHLQQVQGLDLGKDRVNFPTIHLVGWSKPVHA